MIKRLVLIFLLVPIVFGQITIENSPPSFDELENVFIEQKPFTYYIEVSDPEKSTLTLSSDSELFKADMVSKNEGIVQVLPSIENTGIHTVNFEVTDGELSISEEVTFVILPQEFSSKFSLDKSSINLVGEDIENILIKNLDNNPLYVLVETPKFISTLNAAYAEYERELSLQSTATKDSFGIITIRSPKSEIDLPIFHTFIDTLESDLSITSAHESTKASSQPCSSNR